MLCTCDFALVFDQCPQPGHPLGLWGSSREELVGGDIPLKLWICVCSTQLYPLCRCYIKIFLNSFVQVYKCTLSPFVQIMYRNNYFFIIFSLCRRLRWLWRPQHTARRPLRWSACGRPWLLPHVQSQRGAEDPERLWKRGGPTAAGRQWHTRHRVWTGGAELAVCRPQRGQEPGAKRMAGPPRGADWAGWKSSSHSPSKREASSATTPAHTHRKRTPLWFNVSLVGINNYSV